MREKPVIFLAFANHAPANADPSKLLKYIPMEGEEVWSALDKAQDEGLCEVVIKQYATLEGVMNVFRSRKYKDRIAVFHFAGHAQSDGLELSDPLQERELVYMEGFAPFLADQPQLHLVFLNACATEKHAQQLIDMGVPVVIATDRRIKDRHAMEMAVNFYKSLAKGKRIGQAFRDAEHRLLMDVPPSAYRGFYKPDIPQPPPKLPWRLLTHNPDTLLNWNLPEVVDDPLWKIPPPIYTKSAPEPFPYLVPYVEADGYRFAGREQEIQKLYRWYTTDISSRVMMLYGAKGIGKSSLVRAGLLARLPTHTYHYEVLRDEHVDLASIMITDDGDLPFLLVMDELVHLSLHHTEQLLTELAKILHAHPKMRCILIGTSMASERLQALHLSEKLPVKIRYFQVDSLTHRQIERFWAHVHHDPRMQSLYGIEPSPAFIEAVAQFITQDSTAVNPLIFQILLKQLWTHASHSADKVVFDKHLMQEVMTHGLFEDFWEQQGKSFPSAVQASGLTLNVLQLFISRQGHIKLLSEADVLTHFSHIPQQIQELFNQLTNSWVLTEASNTTTTTSGLTPWRLIHLSLIPIIQAEAMLSDRTGQKGKRLINLALQTGLEPLPEKEYQLLQKARLAMPELSDELKTWIERSGKRLRSMKRRKKWGFRFRMGAIAMLILTGVLLNNPYLLLFIVMILLLYQN